MRHNFYLSLPFIVTIACINIYRLLPFPSLALALGLRGFVGA
jgi:hypothetical protein